MNKRKKSPAPQKNDGTGDKFLKYLKYFKKSLDISRIAWYNIVTG